MRKLVALGAGVALAALMGGPGAWAQNDNNAGNGSQQPAQRNIQMVPAKAELQKGLNAKKVRPGQRVTAKLEQTVKLPNEPALQRNTVLEGHVDTVQASQDHSTSKITVTFDQAKLRDGTVLPVKVTVMQVTAPQMAESEAGGPMAGGAGMGPMPQNTGTATGQAGPGGISPAKEDEPSQSVPEPLPDGGVASNQAGIPGVMLRSDIHQSTSATFVARGRNVYVPGGTQMQLAIAYIPQGVQAH